MLCAKLRRAMVNPQREPLSGIVDTDETIIPFRTKNDPIVVPAGRSGVGKMLVAGAVEVDGGTPRRARLKVIEGFGKDEIHAFVLAAAAPNTSW
jgi:ISXO2 transposase-like protein